MQRLCESQAGHSSPARGDFGVSPLCETLPATFCVAREDRDGCSRYRVSKMPAVAGELGWYRDHRRPYAFRGGVYFFEINFGGNSQWLINPTA